jgi:hypothetical protein
MSYAVLYTIIGLWVLTALVGLLNCLSCAVCCCPRKLSRALSVLTGLLVVTSTLVTAFYTHKLQALANGTVIVAKDSVRLAHFLMEQ